MLKSVCIYIDYFVDCSVGYYGQNCSLQCPFNTYGKQCQMFCECPEDSCNFAAGCQKNEKGNQLKVI